MPMGLLGSSHNARRTVLPIAHVTVLAILALAIVAVAMAFAESIRPVPETGTGGNAAPSRDFDAGFSEYVLPDSDSRLYTRDELESLSARDLYIAHNEIYARHGRGFAREDLAEHFSSCSWYQELYTPEEYDAMPSQLNAIEQANSDLMDEIRTARNDDTY